MEPLTAVLTVVSTILAIVLAMSSVSGRFIDWLKATIREVLEGMAAWFKDLIIEVLEDTGLIRHGEGEANWPNGWRNLPDCLDALYETQQRLIDQEEERRED